MSKKQKIIFFTVIFFAIFFRFYLINIMPGGLFPDEAANGLDINLMQQGDLQPFYERGNGRESLFFYMLWASVSLFGKGFWQHHIVSALGGVLAVLACFFVTRRLVLMNETESDEDYKKHWWRATNIALLSMFLMSVSTWHIVLSRTAFRASLIPLFASLVIYFVIRTHQTENLKKRIWFAVLSGAFFALGFYTYIAYRIMLPILFMIVTWPFLALLFKGQVRAVISRYALPVILFLVSFLIVIAPLAKYFYEHPGSFIGRSGQVSIFNQGLYLVDGVQLSGEPDIKTVVLAAAEVARVSLKGFFTSGDLNWRHNISGQPFLPVLVSPFFAVGLLCVSLMGIVYFFLPNRKAKFWKFFVLTGWFWGMLLPVITTAEGIPHGLRAVGLIPSCFVISGWAIYVFWEWVQKAHQHIWHSCEKCQREHYESTHIFLRRKIAETGLGIVKWGFFAALILQAYFAYFVYAYNSPENFYYFRSDLSEVSEYLKARCDKENTYLILDKFSVQTTDYLTSDNKGNFSDKCNVPYIQVDPEESWKLSGLMPGVQVIFAQSSIYDIKKFKEQNPQAFLSLEVRNKFKQTVLAVYEIR